MNNRRLLAIAGLLVPAAVAAQAPRDPHTVQPERPTVATHAWTVAPGWLEVEAGAEFDRYADRSHGFVAPMVFKFGLAQRLQLFLNAALVRPPAQSTAGAGDLTVGLKWRLLDGAPVVGAFAVIGSLKVPNASTTSGLGTGTTDAGLVLISSHQLGPVSVDINVGYTRRSGDGSVAPRSASLWTFSFGGPAVGRFGWTAELYGYPGTSGPAGQAPIVALLGGPTMSVRQWLTLDAGLIVPATGPQPLAFYLGGVWNVGRL